MTETSAGMCVLKQYRLSAAVGIMCYKFNFSHVFITNESSHNSLLVLPYL